MVSAGSQVTRRFRRPIQDVLDASVRPPRFLGRTQAIRGRTCITRCLSWVSRSVSIAEDLGHDDILDVKGASLIGSRELHYSRGLRVLDRRTLPLWGNLANWRKGKRPKPFTCIHGDQDDPS